MSTVFKKVLGHEFAADRNPLRAIRIATGHSQQEAADHVGWSRTLWSSWENQLRPITTTQLHDIVRAYELDRSVLEWIINWWETGTEPPTIAQLKAAQFNDLAGLLIRTWTEKEAPVSTDLRIEDVDTDRVKP